MIIQLTYVIPGNCTAPLGSVQVGLIYANAQGYLGNTYHVREDVALIAGSEVFGKAQMVLKKNRQHTYLNG